MLDMFGNDVEAGDYVVCVAAGRRQDKVLGIAHVLKVQERTIWVRIASRDSILDPVYVKERKYRTKASMKFMLIAKPEGEYGKALSE